MASRLKLALYSFVFLVASLIGFKTYLYFTYSIPPQFELEGLSHSLAYKSSVDCCIKSHNRYKVATLSVRLDGKPLGLKDGGNVGKSRFEMPFSIDTVSLSDGPHKITVTAVDASYNANKKSKEWNFEVDNTPLKAALLQQNYKVDQGRTVHVRVNANKRVPRATVKFLSREYDCFLESPHATTYECFIPLDCEETVGENMLTAELEDSVGNVVKLAGKVSINQFTFKRARGFSIAKDKLKDEQDVSISSKVLEDALCKWVKNSPKEKFWSGKFELPINVQRIITPFGELRTTMEKGRYYHKAVDLINLPRSVVWASQAGKVIIKDRYLESGNTVVIDHGHGVHTRYYHLEDFAPGLEVGDTVKKGNPIGRLGMTGYASGYHLHWELRVNNVAVDPMQWIERAF